MIAVRHVFLLGVALVADVVVQTLGASVVSLFCSGFAYRALDRGELGSWLALGRAGDGLLDFEGLGYFYLLWA